MPLTKKRWLVVLPPSQIEWLQSISKEYRIKGSHIVSEALERVMNDSKFEDSLASTQYKLKLQQLNDKKAALAEEEQELKRLINRGSRVTA